jgi:hypothetical protein
LITLLELLVSWYAGYVPLGKMPVADVKMDLISVYVEPGGIDWECDWIGEGEWFGGDVVSEGHQVSFVSRRSFGKGTCKVLKREIRSIDSQLHGRKLRLGISLYEFNLPPVMPGVSGVFAYIRDEHSMRCFGHFEHLCQVGFIDFFDYQGSEWEDFRFRSHAKL